MSEKPTQCPLCYTKLKVRNNELYCPECGYTYLMTTSSSASFSDLDSTTSGSADVNLAVKPRKKLNAISIILFFAVILVLYFFLAMAETDLPKLLDEVINLTQESSQNTDIGRGGSAATVVKGRGTDEDSKQAVEHLLSYIADNHGIERERITREIWYLRVYSDSSGNLVWNYYLLNKLSGTYMSEDTNFQMADLEQFPELINLFLPEVSLQKGDLKSFTKLQGLECCNTPAELTKIIDPEQITYLVLHDSNHNLRSLAKLNKFSNLRYLNIDSDILLDLSPLSSCKWLTSLELYVPNYKGDYNFLKNMTSLTALSIRTDQLKDLEFLKNCPKLQIFAFSRDDDDPSLSLKGLEYLQDLQELSITFTPVQTDSLDILAKNPNLITLYMEYCRLSDVSFLKGFDNLTVLSLQGNRIERFSDLPALPNLTSLNLTHNMISEIPDDTSAWPSLNLIHIKLNNLSAESIQSFTTNHPEISVYYSQEN